MEQLQHFLTINTFNTENCDLWNYLQFQIRTDNRKAIFADKLRLRNRLKALN